MAAPIVELSGLEKRFGNKYVLRKIDLTIEAGQHIGLVGNNGAGKTTLLRLLLGLLQPDNGQVTLNGEVASYPRSRSQKLCFGYLPEAMTFYPALTGWRTLRFLARLKGVAPKDARPLLDLVGLSQAADERVKTYSKGMRQRLGLAQALLGNPQLLLLDEPTNGLDPQGIQEFYAILETLQSKQVAILTATHLLTEIESRLDYLYLLKGGQFEKSGTVNGLIEAAELPIGIRLELKSVPQNLRCLLNRLGAQMSCHRRPQIFDIECSAEAKLDVLQELFRHRDDLEALTIVEPGLEAVFHHYQETDSSRFSTNNLHPSKDGAS